MRRQSKSYEDLLADLQAARIEWGKLGHNLRGTRVGSYERELGELIEMGPEGRSELGQKAGRVFLLGVEISEFLFVSRIALARPHLSQSRRVAEIFGGADLADKEGRGNSGLPRNTLFELTIACLIEGAGLRAEFGGAADVRTDFQGVPFYIECKRPQSPRKVESNIRDGCRQLRELERAPTSIGIVAICIGKLFTQGDRLLRAPSVEAMAARLHLECDEFFRSSLRYWQATEAADALMVRLSTAADVSGQQFHAHPISGYPRPKSDPAKHDLIHAFARAIGDSLSGEEV